VNCFCVHGAACYDHGVETEGGRVNVRRRLFNDTDAATPEPDRMVGANARFSSNGTKTRVLPTSQACV